MSWRELLLVAAGGAIGAVARWGVNLVCAELLGSRFPWGTFVVNVVGCFLLGWLLHSKNLSVNTQVALGTGVLGAFTTFSTFGVQTIQTWNREPMLAVANVMANVLLGLLAALAGMYLATKLAAAG